MVPSKETRLPKFAIRSPRVTAPILLTLGAINAWLAAVEADYAALSTALCLCVCAAGLFGEDLVQRGHRQDLVVLAHVAAHPGAETRGIAQAVGVPERLVARNLDRLVEEGFVVQVEGDVHPALRSYRLPS
ncbi:winged helix-turn-helix domain-containing protein [Streptomyces bauhiniae]|uniref:winged helix-turn-helix domain-containing protein n=1 Tax=Streptomyces bauhiniae TaxID=2340725 RepID=UPI003816C3A9